MANLTALSATQMREGLLKGDFSAVELTRAHLARIEETNDTFNCLLQVTGKEAEEAAARADSELGKFKENTPPLTGIPLTVKDLLVTEGVETTAGSKILKGFIPPYTCTAVKRAKDAGAVLIGKANLDEFAMGSSNESSAFGPTRNPWNPDLVPGGSSGGSAASVSLGQAPLSLGTDTGGSIRQPAGFCGVLGLKPTYGRVSRYGAIAYASSLDQIGPFARTTDDLALMLEVISGKDNKDSTSMDRPVDSFSATLRAQRENSLSGMRIGIPKEYFIAGIDASVAEKVRAAITALQKQGAEVVDISLPHTEYALAAYYIIALAEASSNLSRYDGVRYGFRHPDARTLRDLYELSRAEGFGEEVKRRILLGTYVLSAGYYDAYYKKAQQLRTLIIRDFKQAFTTACDVIITPTSPTTAFPIGAKSASPLEMYLADIFTVPINLAGLPAISVPCGLDAEGLPVGLQVIGKAFDENAILRISDKLLQTVPFDMNARITNR